MIPLGEADIMRRGGDITVVGWGSQLRVLENVGVGEAHVFYVFS
jgi:pyruvate/2-oxoglutarate/acetoin dehydrogenase E1 component